MTDVSLIVGGVVAEIARSSLTDAAGAHRPAVRISGFDEREVAAIVDAMRGFRLPGTSEDVTIKVGTTTDIAGIDPRYRLAAGETLTHWRNEEVTALVVIDWDPQGDEEGLAALNRLGDRSVLTEDDEELASQRFDLVVEHAWSATGRGDVPPGRLRDDLSAVRRATVEAHNLSLRRWTAYVAEVCSHLADVELLTPHEVDRAVGRDLPTLGLFPDLGLFNEDRAVRTRLVRNVRVSDLRQPGGATISEDDLLARIEATEFDADLLQIHNVVAATLRERMRAVVQGGGFATRRQIDLALWLELFERRADQAGLGQLVREHIAATAPDRLDEFENLDVEAGLDHSEQEAAERLLRAEPVEGEPTLTDLLASRLRRRVEKVAFPDAQIAADPLRALLHGVHVLEDVEGPVVRLGLEGISGDGEWSQWL